jgi:hypothetical protein
MAEDTPLTDQANNKQVNEFERQPQQAIECVPSAFAATRLSKALPLTI